MAITKKSGRQEEIVAYQIIDYSDLTSLYGTAVGVTQGAISLPVGSLVIGGSLIVNTALETEGVKAVSTLTTSTVPSAAQVVVVGAQTYTYRAALSTGPTVPNEILIGTEAATNANLAAAINGSGVAGVNYSTGTVSQPTVVVATSTQHTVVLTAYRGGVSTVATTTTHGAGSFDHATLYGGLSGADTIAVKIGAEVYKTAADVTAAGIFSLVPTGTVLTADNTVDILHAVAASTIGLPIAGILHLVVRYIVTTREEWSQGV